MAALQEFREGQHTFEVRVSSVTVFLLHNQAYVSTLIHTIFPIFTITFLLSFFYHIHRHGVHLEDNILGQKH